MSRMTIEDFEGREFYQVPKWLIEIKGLQPADILIYMLAYNNWRLSLKNGKVESDGSVYFYLTHESIKEKLDLGKNQIIDAIKRLLMSGALIRTKENGKASKFYLENDMKEIKFDITSLKKSSTQNQTAPVTKIRPDQSEKSDYHQSEKGDINKKELSKNKISNNNTIIKEQLEKENISPELKSKLYEFIDYRKEIKKPIKTYKAIGNLIKQIGKDFIDEQHLIDSIEVTFTQEYQGVFPVKLKKQRNEIGTIKESYATRKLREIRKAQVD